MKAIFITLAALAASVVAQDLSGLPSCALQCVSPFLDGAPGCGKSDFACICKSEPVQNQIRTCLMDKCSAADQETTVKVASSLCSSFGVNIPTTLAAGTTSAPTATPTTGYRNTTTTTSNHTTPHTTTSTGAAATGYIANGLGVVGAAVAGFFFL